jgi:hypothetical protein
VMMLTAGETRIMYIQCTHLIHFNYENTMTCQRQGKKLKAG